MSKMFAVYVVFKWKDLEELIKSGRFSKSDIVFIIDVPMLTTEAATLTDNVRLLCRRNGITLVEDYDELQEEIYRRKLGRRAS